MKNLTEILFYINLTLAGLVIIFSSCMTTALIRLKAAKIRIILFEISKSLKENRSFHIVYNNLQKLPLEKLPLIENCEIDDYVQANLKYFLSSSEFRSKIELSRMNAKRKSGLLQMFNKSIIRKTPIEKLAKIYIELLFNDMRGDDTSKERDFLMNSIVYAGNEKLAFRDIVLQKVEAQIEQMESADQITLIKAEIIKFKRRF